MPGTRLARCLAVVAASFDALVAAGRDGGRPARARRLPADVPALLVGTDDDRLGTARLG